LNKPQGGISATSKDTEKSEKGTENDKMRTVLNSVICVPPG